MANRRNFIKTSALAAAAVVTQMPKVMAEENKRINKPLTVKPIVISTWKFGIEANEEAWKILANSGRALDAVETGVKIIEGNIL